MPAGATHLDVMCWDVFEVNIIAKFKGLRAIAMALARDLPGQSLQSCCLQYGGPGWWNLPTGPLMGQRLVGQRASCDFGGKGMEPLQKAGSCTGKVIDFMHRQTSRSQDDVLSFHANVPGSILQVLLPNMDQSLGDLSGLLFNESFRGRKFKSKQEQVAGPLSEFQTSIC